MAKTKVLAEATRRFEEVEKAKTNLAKELASLHEQMEKVKADVVVEFKVSLDDLLLMTSVASDKVVEESDDSTHIGEHIPINDGMVIAQPVPKGHVATSVPSVENPSAQDAQNPLA